MAHLIRPKASRFIKNSKFQALLITNLTNLQYLTGLKLSAGCLLALPTGYKLFLDPRYLEAGRSCEHRGLKVVPLEKLEGTLKQYRKVAFEAETVTVATLARWKKCYPKISFTPTSGLVEECRRQKFPDELRRIRKACSITKKVLRNIPLMLKPGISELSLAFRIETRCRELGADGMAFDTIVAFGEHSSRPHHRPTERLLRKTDLVQIDMGASYRGYCSDYSRVFFLSKPTEKQKRAMKALKTASRSARAALEAGVSNRQLDTIARKELLAFGFDKEFSHALGHGVGIDIHEGVTLSSKAPLSKLLKNEVVTIEPGLYFDGEWGMRIEETLVVS